MTVKFINQHVATKIAKPVTLTAKYNRFLLTVKSMSSLILKRDIYYEIEYKFSNNKISVLTRENINNEVMYKCNI